MTGNGSYSNLESFEGKNSWNHFCCTYFQRILAFRNRLCASENGGENWKAARYFLLFLTKRTERNMQIAYYWPKSSAFLIFCSSWKFFGYWCWFSQTIVVIFCKYLPIPITKCKEDAGKWFAINILWGYSSFFKFFKLFQKKFIIKSLLTTPAMFSLSTLSKFSRP